jgi:hypothetical protein
VVHVSYLVEGNKLRTFQINYNDVKWYNVARPLMKIILVGALSLLLYSAVDSTEPTAQARELDSVTNMITSVFGPYAAGALRVARCESGLNARAYNRISVRGSHSVGVFQILYPSTWRGTTQAARSPYNAWANILAAHEIFVRDGRSWREWVCRA